MRCQEVVCIWDKNINSWIFDVKQYEENIANEQVKMGEKSIKSTKSHTQKEFTVNGWESQTLNFET